MARFTIAVVCLANIGVPLFPGATPALGACVYNGFDVLGPVQGTPWTRDRMRDARDRLKDVLPGKRD